MLNIQKPPSSRPGPKTNYEKIKSMTIEELAKFLTSKGASEDVGDIWCRDHCECREECIGDSCHYEEETAVLNWLKLEVKDDNLCKQ